MVNRFPEKIVALVLCCLFVTTPVVNAADQPDLFQTLDDKTQAVKLRVLELNREINKYAAKSNTEVAQLFKGKNRAEFSLDFVFRDNRNGNHLAAINRYHAGRDFGVILSKYETALRVANIYLDYGLYHYAKRIFTSLLGDEDSAVASLARYYLAKHDYLKHYWDDALEGFESVTDGIPVQMLDKKRIMQSIILQSKTRHDEAVRVLSDILPSSKHYVYARFNMAMSYLRKGWWSDAEDIIYTLLKNDNSSNKLSPQLRDRFYIALGYSQLQREYYREAYSSLKKVSKNGPYSYKAQLGLGIVAAEQEKYKESLKLLENLKQTYSRQLVAEEAHIVIPFILESIGSLEATTNYYANAVGYYQDTLREILEIQGNLEHGQYDNIFTNVSSDRPDITENTESRIKFESKPINRYVYELLESNRWLGASRNYRDIMGLSEFLGQLKDELIASGKYNKKRYNKLSDTITKYKTQTNSLSDQYREYLRSLIEDHLDIRKNYFLSYMNQSQFALARIYDSTLGSKLETKIANRIVTEKEVRSLYRRYLDNAKQSSHNRRTAMLRLAELELDRYDQLMAAESARVNKAESDKRLTVSIKLMTDALQDYPDNKDNDKLLYQLVTAYEKQSQPEKALVAMRQLVDNYPQSRFYTEIQFKLGEKYLTTNDSIDAELAYSAAVQRESVNSTFYWRALYKRGWSRLRQSVYEDALDDFFQVLDLSGLTEQTKLDASDSELYNDLLRAISLCFSNMGGLEKLNEYFNAHSDSPYAYLAYEELGKMYEDQQRDYDAVEVYDAYVKNNKMSPHAPGFLLEIIQVWQNAKQPDKELDARKLFEARYTIDSPFWKKNDIAKYKNIRQALEANVVYMASHYHGLYQHSHNAQHLKKAKQWYEKFVKYDSNANDAAQTYFRYAELLSDSGEPDKALAFYEKADKGNTNLQSKKEASYAAVVTADTIFSKNYSKEKNKAEQDKWLLRQVGYTMSFVTNFPGDKRSPDAVLHTVDNLYSHALYKNAIEVIENIPQAAKIRIKNELQLYKAHCLFSLNDYGAAEKIYSALYNLSPTDKLDRNLIADRLASSIYKQGESAEKSGNDSDAVKHYLRVYQKTPDSKYAPVAEFDAANVLLKTEKYDNAVVILEKFLKNFKGHRLQPEVNNKLAVIYLKETRKEKAVLAFERAAEDVNNEAGVRRDALWQAAAISEDLGNQDKAIHLYQRYVDKYSSYHETAMEAKKRLAALYRQRNDIKNRYTVLQSMVESESKIRRNMSTDRTKYLAANAALELAERDVKLYTSIRIAQPLKITLKKKKTALQNLVEELTKITDYAIEDTTTQAIFLIAEAYNEFSKALINSPRPGNLRGIELEQYELLLEEQAFPFEEKALTFYKENLKNIKQGVFNKWVKSSFDQLTRLVPARYDKHEKLEAFIDIPLESVSVAAK